MGEPFVFRRAVRFDEIDAAGFVFYAKLVAFAHEGLERMLEARMPGGYASFVVGRKIGLPCVHLEGDFSGPLRFGDTIEVSMSVARFGTSSVTFDVRVQRVGGMLCAKLVYVVACSDLTAPRATPLPADLRAALQAHVVA
jgi:4-hydroxybenzoyl-CoA thioesterase